MKIVCGSQFQCRLDRHVSTLLLFVCRLGRIIVARLILDGVIEGLG